MSPVSSLGQTPGGRVQACVVGVCAGIPGSVLRDAPWKPSSWFPCVDPHQHRAHQKRIFHLPSYLKARSAVTWRSLEVCWAPTGLLGPSSWGFWGWQGVLFSVRTSRPVVQVWMKAKQQPLGTTISGVADEEAGSNTAKQSVVP